MGFAAKTDWEYDETVTESDQNRVESAINAVYQGVHNYGASATGTDSYAVVFSVPFTVLNEGLKLRVKMDVANTGASSLTIDSNSPISIKVISSTGKIDTRTGNILAGGIYDLEHDGVDFILTNPSIVESDFAPAVHEQAGSTVIIDSIGFDGNLDDTVTDVQELAQAVDDMSTSDINNGRYQAEFGFYGAAYSGCELVSNKVKLINDFNYRTHVEWGLNGSSSGYSEVGWIFTPDENLTGLRVIIGSTFGHNTVSIKRTSDNVVMATSAASANQTISLSATLVSGTSYRLVASGGGAGASYKWSSAGQMGVPYSNNGMTITAGYGDTNTSPKIFTKIETITDPRTTTGTVIKRLSSQGVERYGNLKITLEDDNANNSATVHIDDILGNELIAPITLANGENYIDLSTINATTYPAIDIVYTENRNTTSDPTPALSSPSVTALTVTNNWNVITTIKPNANWTSAICDFTGRQYRALRIWFSLKSSTSTSRNLIIKFNDNDTNYVNKLQVRHDNSLGAVWSRSTNDDGLILLEAAVYNATNNMSQGCITIHNNTTVTPDSERNFTFDYSTETSSGQYTQYFGHGQTNSVREVIEKLTFSISADSFLAGSEIIIEGLV